MTDAAARSFSVDLGSIPLCPVGDEPFSEPRFTRRSLRHTFTIHEVAVVFVNVCNWGWEDGPIIPGHPEWSFEHGRSHAIRKRAIVEKVLDPIVTAARHTGVHICHANLPAVLARYPTWKATGAVGAAAEASQPESPTATEDGWPPAAWADAWRRQQQARVWGKGTAWQTALAQAGTRLDIPAPLRPLPGEWLVAAAEPLHRLLEANGVRVLLYAGFEADGALWDGPCGMARLMDRGYLCVAIREGTTAVESADSFRGLWRTRCAVEDLERGGAYTVSATELRAAWSAVAPQP